MSNVTEYCNPYLSPNNVGNQETPNVFSRDDEEGQKDEKQRKVDNQPALRDTHPQGQAPHSVCLTAAGLCRYGCTLLLRRFITYPGKGSLLET